MAVAVPHRHGHRRPGVYRWLDYADKATVISANRCTDWVALGLSTYGVGDTSYHLLHGARPGSAS